VLVSTTPVHAHGGAAVTASVPVSTPPAVQPAVQNGAAGSGGNGQQQGGSRRNRHRGQQQDHDHGAARPAPVAEVETVAIQVAEPPVEPVTVEQPTVEQPAVETARVEPAPAETAPIDVPAERAATIDVGSPNGHQPMVHQPPPAVAVANPPRPTRRRAASRPAGPPAGEADQRGESTPV
jgi:ribonuclease E